MSDTSFVLEKFGRPPLCGSSNGLRLEHINYFFYDWVFAVLMEVKTVAATKRVSKRFSTPAVYAVS